MALFKRRNKQNTDVLPAEVREYYQSERRERAGVAWMLALGTLVLTFVIAAGLFFGGRWAYRTVFNNDKDTNKQTASQNDGLRVDEKGNVTGGNNQSTSTGTNNGSTGTSSASTNTPSSNGNTNSGTATTPTTTPNTGDVTPAQLINTGPGDE